MATRGDIKDGFYAELGTLSGTYNVTDSNGNVVDTVTLDTDDIGLIEVENQEQLPTVVWDVSFQNVVYNGVGAGPDFKTYDSTGDVVVDERWREYEEAQFTVFVRAGDESEKEAIYRNLRETFGKYQFNPWSETNIHEDVINLEMDGVNSADSADEEDVIRGDQVTVILTFYRDYVLDEDEVKQVEQQVDADDDGTTDDSYTTT